MKRPESGLQLAEAFSDKEHMVTICDHLDRQNDENCNEEIGNESVLNQTAVCGSVSRSHDHLMSLLTRVPEELQLADFALQVI